MVATFAGPLTGEIVLSTSGGRVRAFVPSGANFELDASTSGGRVRADGLTLMITHGGVNRSSLRARWDPAARPCACTPAAAT